MSKKTKTKVTPWAPAEPFIKDSLGALQGANRAGQATLDANMPGINSAIARATQVATTPPAYSADARSQLDKTINGDFLNSDPHAGALADLIAQKTGAQYNSTFGSAGRAHGGLAALLSGQGVGDALQQFYSDQYNNERGRQQQAIMAAPAFNQDEYTGVNNLIPAVGNTAMLPGQVAGQYSSGVAQATSPYSTTTQKQGGLGSALSTGLGLASLVAAPFTGGLSLGLAGGLAGGGMAGQLVNKSKSFLG